jgi:hypothetical protein
MRWFIPSWHGDVSLKAENDVTLVELTDVTQREAEALRTLRLFAIRKKWAEAEEWKVFDFKPGSPFRLPAKTTLMLRAPIAKVEKKLVSLLKPNRKVLRAVMFSDGKFARVTGGELEVEPEPASAAPQPPADAPSEPQAPLAKTEETKPAKPKAAATVAAPVLGCPLQVFDPAEIRATRVLKAFLTDQQLRDFERSQQFIMHGYDTGRPYLLTSRHARAALEKVGPYSLYDMQDSRSLCVHDWEVPAAEELLGLQLHLAVPGGESYLRGLS